MRDGRLEYPGKARCLGGFPERAWERDLAAMAARHCCQPGGKSNGHPCAERFYAADASARPERAEASAKRRPGTGRRNSGNVRESKPLFQKGRNAGAESARSVFFFINCSAYSGDFTGRVSIGGRIEPSILYTPVQARLTQYWPSACARI